MFKKLFPLEVFRSIDYFGCNIRLRKTYWGLKSYVLDSENIPMAEAFRLESFMKGVPFGPIFITKKALIIAFVGIKFPGYGSFYANQMHANPEQKLELMSAVIPRTGKNRYFVAEMQLNGSFLVVADFIAQALGIVKVIAQGDSLAFLSRNNEVMLVRRRSHILCPELC